MKAFRKAGVHDGGVNVVLEERGKGGSASVLKVKEDITLVDGLGGGVWDGSLLMCDLIKDWLRPCAALPAAQPTPFESSTSGLASNFDVSTSVAKEGESAYIVELGAGTGLLGMVAYATNNDVDVCVTDRYSDLLTENCNDLNRRGLEEGVEVYSSVQDAMRDELFYNKKDEYALEHDSKSIYSKSEWGNDHDEKDSIVSPRGTVSSSSNASPKRNRSPTSTDAQEKSPSEEHPRKRLNSTAEDKHDDNKGDNRGEEPRSQGKSGKREGRGSLTAEELTWTVKHKSNSGFNPSPTSEEMTILYTPLPGSTYANTPRYPDLILGAEIAVLQKQQEALVSTVSRLAGPKTMVLLSVDDVPAYPAKSKYERNLDESFREAGFLKIFLSAGRVRWEESELSKRSSGVIDDNNVIMSSSDDKYGDRRGVGRAGDEQGGDAKVGLPLPPAVDSKRVKSAYIEYLPIPSSSSSSSSTSTLADKMTDADGNHNNGAGHRNNSGGFEVSLASHQRVIDHLSDSLQRLPLDSPPPLPGDTSSAVGGGLGQASSGSGGNDDLDSHHINAYFKASLLSTCARCHGQFLNNPRLFNNPHCRLFNSHMVCRYHPQYYVCRFHPAETASSGDGLGYYGNGEEGYEAKFWDCCGAEDEKASGCVQGLHIAYL